jgi:hypothetical protein
VLLGQGYSTPQGAVIHEYRAVVTNLWFENHLGVRKIFQGVREKISVMVYFLSSKLHGKTIGNLVSIATAYVSRQFTLIHCSFIVKLLCLIFHLFLLLFLWEVREIIHYHERGWRDVKGLEPLLQSNDGVTGKRVKRKTRTETDSTVISSTTVLTRNPQLNPGLRSKKPTRSRMTFG